MMARKRNERERKQVNYPAFQLPSFRMDLHTQQQSMILNELAGSRRKLEEENQALRDELAESQLTIRLLQLTVKQKSHSCKEISRNKESLRVSRKDVKRLTHLHRKDKSTRRRSSAPLLLATKSEVFRNPLPLGKKTFTVRKHLPEERKVMPPSHNRRSRLRTSPRQGIPNSLKAILSRPEKKAYKYNPKVLNISRVTSHSSSSTAQSSFKISNEKR